MIITSKGGDNIKVRKKIENHSFGLGAIGSTLSGLALTLATYNDYGRVMTKFFMGRLTMSGMFHLQRTWIIYWLILVIGLTSAQLGHKQFRKIYGNKPSNSSLFVLLTCILLIFSFGLLTYATPINWRGEVVPYWSVCLFEDWNIGILFSALTLSILASLGITQISWGNIYLGSYQNSKKHNLTRITGISHFISGTILLFAFIPLYWDLFGYAQFHFLLFVPFLVAQIITSITFLTLKKPNPQARDTRAFSS